MAISIADLPWLPPAPADFNERCKAIIKSGAPDAAALIAAAHHKLDETSSRLLGRALRQVAPEAAQKAGLSPFKLAVISANTFDFLASCLPAAGLRRGLAIDAVMAPYGQIAQEALNPGAETYSVKADATLVVADQNWLGLNAPQLSGNGAGRAAEAVARMREVAEALLRGTGKPAILQTLCQPSQTLFGSFDRQVAGSIRGIISSYNDRLANLARELSCPLFDVAALAERVGLERWFNPLQWNAYKLPFDAAYGPLYADCLARLLGAMRGKSRKCLVLDLDNTLWGGAIGDEGLDGIVLGEGSALGEAFLSVQRYALSLRQRGILLAVSSKNDDANARKPFQSHPDMLLKENHIAVFQANWIDKASNLEAVAKTLNIGVDALVLLDDNPAERAAVRASLPMVAVPELPSDPARFVEILDAAGYFEAVELSGDDLLRADAIQSNALRADVMQRARSIDDYLDALEMELSLSAFRPEERQRITQLANKTNQFNLTTRRYAESEIAALETDAHAFTLQARLRDRFGDMGLISLLIAKPDRGDETAWDIETWLMSCRVLGREVERGVLGALVQAAEQKGVRKLRGTYIPTPKNGMVAEHYRKLGFTQSGGEPGGRSLWELDATSYQPAKLPFKLTE